MEGVISDLVSRFERGHVSRRDPEGIPVQIVGTR